MPLLIASQSEEFHLGTQLKFRHSKETKVGETDLPPRVLFLSTIEQEAADIHLCGSVQSTLQSLLHLLWEAGDSSPSRPPPGSGT